MSKKILIFSSVVIVLIIVIAAGFLIINSNAELEATKAKLAATKARLHETQLQITATAQVQATVLATKPPIPISITCTNAMLEQSIVCHFKNTSTNKYLSVKATFLNPTLNRQKTFALSIAPGQEEQFGYAQGWAFHSEDKILLHNDDYSDWTVTIP